VTKKRTGERERTVGERNGKTETEREKERGRERESGKGQDVRTRSKRRKWGGVGEVTFIEMQWYIYASVKHANFIYTYILTYVCICIYIYIHMYIYTYVDMRAWGVGGRAHK